MGNYPEPVRIDGAPDLRRATKIVRLKVGETYFFNNSGVHRTNSLPGERRFVNVKNGEPVVVVHVDTDCGLVVGRRKSGAEIRILAIWPQGEDLERQPKHLDLHPLLSVPLTEKPLPTAEEMAGPKRI